MSCPPPNPPPVVIDNGSWTLKCGVAGDRTPKFELPSTNAIQDGNVVQWDAATELWKDAFSKLNTKPDTQPILLTEPISAGKSDREKMAEIMFEGLNASSIYLANQPVLSLYAAGKMDGAVVQIGHGVTQVIASCKGFAVPSSCIRNTFAGQKLNELMGKLIAEESSTVLEADTARDIKEKHGYVALNFEQELQKLDSVKKPYKLPDGKEVTIGKPRFACPEALFNPSLAGVSTSGIHTLLRDSIANGATESKLSADVLYGNIVITGGSSEFSGMKERFTKEIQAVAPSGTTVDVVATPGTSCFIGGSILTCLDTMNPLWVTKQMYLDSGASIVHEKCA